VIALNRCLALSTPDESQVRKTYSLLVGCLARLGRQDEAQEACRNGLELFPQDVELLFRAGQLAQHFGRLGDAEAAYLAALRNAEPRHFTSIDAGVLSFKTHHNLALVYTAMGDLARAEEQWRKATIAAPDWRDGWRGLGDILMRQAKYDELARLVDQLLGVPGCRPLALAWQAHTVRVRGEYEEAAARLQAAVDAYPDDSDVVQACAQLLFEAGDPAECEKALHHLLRLLPDEPGAYHNLGTLYRRSGRHRLAIEALRKSIELSPRNAEMHLHLGYALAATGDRDRATRAFAAALRLEPSNKLALDAMGQFNAQLTAGPVHGGAAAESTSNHLTAGAAT
jgi:tetratricopeptide (TPR) repeat protein